MDKDLVAAADAELVEREARRVAFQEERAAAGPIMDAAQRRLDAARAAFGLAIDEDRDPEPLRPELDLAREGLVEARRKYGHLFDGGGDDGPGRRGLFGDRSDA